MLTDQQIKDQNEKKALEELRVIWLRNHRDIHWFDLGEGVRRDPNEEQEVELLRGEAKIKPREEMSEGFKRREDGFFKRDVYFDGQSDVTIYGYPTSSAIENAQLLLASQGMMVSTYNVKPVGRIHIEALIARYSDALGMKLSITGELVPIPGAKPEVPLMLLRLGPDVKNYISLCTMGAFGRVVGASWLGFWTTGRAKGLLKLYKEAERQFNESIKSTYTDQLGKDEIEKLQAAMDKLSDTHTHPPAPVAQVDRDNHINNNVFAAGDDDNAKLAKIGAELTKLATRQQAMLTEKDILTREIADSRRMIASPDTHPSQIDDLVIKLERQEEARIELMNVLDREEGDLRGHFDMWRAELNKPQYAGLPNQQVHMNKLADMEGKPPIATPLLRADYIQLDADARAKQAAPNPVPPPAPNPGP